MRSHPKSFAAHAPGAVLPESHVPFHTHHASSSAATSEFAWPRRHTKKSLVRSESTWGQSNETLATRCAEAVWPKNGSAVLLEPISDNTLFISLNLSSPSLVDDRRNHCCPVLGVLPDPHHNHVQYAVKPPLTKYEDLKFKTVRDAIVFFQQLLQGLEFMHENYVAHRDCSSAHIAMRAGSNPPEYYLTLSPASRLYRLNSGRPLAMPFWGTDKSIPEFQRSPTEPHDPFRADVYCLGNLIRRDFLEVYSNLQFMTQLVTEMTLEDAVLRPTMDEVVDRFTALASQLSDRAMARPLRKRWRPRFHKLFRNVSSS